jgi:hypothetical protein
MLHNSATGDLPKDAQFPPGHFSQDMFSLDRDLSAVFRDRGHYVIAVASRPFSGT